MLTGHEHNYERFAPLDAEGRIDNVRGIREFVVGTGGRGHYPFGTPLPTSRIRNADTYGVLRQFIGTGQAAFTDSGTGVCH